MTYHYARLALLAELATLGKHSIRCNHPTRGAVSVIFEVSGRMHDRVLIDE